MLPHQKSKANSCQWSPCHHVSISTCLACQHVIMSTCQHVNMTSHKPVMPGHSNSINKDMVVMGSCHCYIIRGPLADPSPYQANAVQTLLARCFTCGDPTTWFPPTRDFSPSIILIPDNEFLLREGFKKGGIYGLLPSPLE